MDKSFGHSVEEADYKANPSEVVDCLCEKPSVPTKRSLSLRSDTDSFSDDCKISIYENLAKDADFKVRLYWIADQNRKLFV